MKGLQVAFVATVLAEPGLDPVKATGAPMVRLFVGIEGAKPEDSTTATVVMLGELAERALDAPPSKGETVYIEGKGRLTVWEGKAQLNVLARSAMVLGRFPRPRVAPSRQYRAA
jgi:uncharacterized protein YbjT (DUF2867 family)